MNKYFKENVWCRCTPETAKILYDIIRSRNIPASDSLVMPYEENYPHYRWFGKNKYIMIQTKGSSQGEITLGEMIDLLMSISSNEVVLNSEYTAEIISATEVKVGCQTFHISKIEEILEKMNKLK